MVDKLKSLIVPVLIVLGIGIIATLIGLGTGVVMANKAETKPVNMTVLEVKNLKIKMQSSVDKEEHPVRMDLYFELGEDLASMISLREIRKQLVEMLGTLEYERCTGKDNVDYIVNFIESKFSDKIDHREVGKVYITKMVTGDLNFITKDEEVDAAEETMNTRVQDKFDGLFGD